MIAADGRVPYTRVVEIMDVLRSNGIEQLSLAVEGDLMISARGRRRKHARCTPSSWTWFRAITVYLRLVRREQITHERLGNALWRTCDDVRK